jgi:hypothetical protein
MNLDDMRLRHLALEKAEELYRSADQIAMPEQTAKEMEAGRAALMRDLRGSIIDVGYTELVRRFTKRAVPSEPKFHFDATSNEWVAEIGICTADKKTLVWSEQMLKFPSDELFAQIALVT